MGIGMSRYVFSPSPGEGPGGGAILGGKGANLAVLESLVSEIERRRAG